MTEKIVAPGENASVNCTCDAADGPWLDTVIRQVTSAPDVTGSGEAEQLTFRSAFAPNRGAVERTSDSVAAMRRKQLAGALPIYKRGTMIELELLPPQILSIYKPKGPKVTIEPL